ncbi:MAG: mannose-1-phosphate guanylyltransferase/mannose-6-phosphate isomerase [Alphaproteobacteria bacterium]|nr:MAG: mannose-1-phosphate guanylyltransferase/mannose-6-phosphate isomerase [Alphaproteobacteria bacterium]
MPNMSEDTSNIIPVILAGAAGTRLWPISRPDLPKQFQPVIGRKTLFQQTVIRLSEAGLGQKPIIMTNQEHIHLVTAQLAQINILDADIIAEPSSQDTAPAILIAALTAFRRNPNSQILTFPSDHRINNIDVLKDTIENKNLDRKSFIAFGIKAEKPSSSYGYIKYTNTSGAFLLEIISFTEKPGHDTAKSFIKQGNYLWNSGMYFFPTALFIDRMQILEPEMVHHCMGAIFRGKHKKKIFTLDLKTYRQARKISIDHALMEKIDDAKVVKISLDWNDIGSWSSVWECSDQDEKGNVKLGNVVCSNSHGSYIRSDGKLTAVIGLDDVIVITMDDAVLVARKSEAQNLKQLMRKLKKRHCKEIVAHSSVVRPWGNYKIIQGGDQFQVKRILVNPGQTLSLQYHHFRAEHWTIVSGKADVTVDGTLRLMKANDSVYIPIEATHRIANPYDKPVEFIEVQCGSYLGEDDIIRLEDVYGRVAE